MPRRKTWHDTTGFITGCPSYNPCPLCYGCRAYSAIYKMCEKCEENFKRDICDREKHREDLLARMISRERIEIKGGSTS